jgi:hypothetical protein
MLSQAVSAETRICRSEEPGEPVEHEGSCHGDVQAGASSGHCHGALRRTWAIAGNQLHYQSSRALSCTRSSTNEVCRAARAENRSLLGTCDVVMVHGEVPLDEELLVVGIENSGVDV